MSLRISTGRSNSAAVSRSPAVKVKRASPSGRPLRSRARTTPLSPPLGRGAQDLDAERAGRVLGRRERARRLDAAVDHGDRAAAGGAREPFDEFVRPPEVDAVGEPEQLDVGRRGEEARDRRQRLGALDRVRLRPDLPEPHACGARRFERDVACRLRQRHDGDAGLVGLGARDQVLGGAHAPVPGRGRGPAVVDQRASAGATADEVAIGGFHSGPAAAMISSAASSSRSSSSHQGVRAGVSSLRRDVEQEPRRREIDAARARRDEPQQPPQHRQADAVRAAPAARRRRAEGPSWKPPRGRQRVPAVDAGAVRAGAHAGMQPQQQVGGRPVGAVDRERPAEPVGLGADLGAVALHPGLVLLAPGLGAARP